MRAHVGDVYKLTQTRQPAILVVCYEYFATFKIKIGEIMGPK
jgi:hypothetical protein